MKVWVYDLDWAGGVVVIADTKEGAYKKIVNIHKTYASEPKERVIRGIQEVTDIYEFYGDR